MTMKIGTSKTVKFTLEIRVTHERDSDDPYSAYVVVSEAATPLFIGVGKTEAEAKDNLKKIILYHGVACPWLLSWKGEQGE